MSKCEVGEVIRTSDGKDVLILARTGLHRTVQVVGEEHLGTHLVHKYNLVHKQPISPLSPTVLKIGCLGVGEFTKDHEEYGVWEKLLKEHGDRLCADWRNYNKFAKWFYRAKQYSSHYKIAPVNTTDDEELGPWNTFYIPTFFIGLMTGRVKGRSVPQGIISGRKWQVREIGSARIVGSFTTKEAAIDCWIDTRNAEMQKWAEEYRYMMPPEAYNALIQWRARF